MERTYTLQDLLAVLRRRRVLAIVVGAAVLLVGVAVTAFMPSEYTAASTVQIEPRRLPVDYFPAQGVAPFEDRMRTIKHGILARPVMERALKETDFFPELRDDMDQAVERLRRQVEVRLEGEVPGGPPALLFVVEVRGRDPGKVKRVAELLPRIYEDMTREVLAGQARALRDTLDAQVKDMSGALAAEEQKILEFKLQHASELPEMIETNVRAAARAESLLEIHVGAIADARRRKVAALGGIPEGASAPGLTEAALDTAMRKLQAAEAAYGADHPDVRRARREWQEALAHRDEENDRYRKERLQETLTRLDGEIREHGAAVADLSKELALYQQRVEAAPRWGQEIAARSRDYETLRAKYVSTVARRADAAVAVRLLDADVQALFRVVEAAVTPGRPSSPDRVRLLGLAVLVAVAAALATAAMAEWLDGSMRGPEDAASLGVPVLAAIPRIGPHRTQAT
jgi:uncharacterized protein involved in exopolysaccharide biosynthesis